MKIDHLSLVVDNGDRKTFSTIWNNFVKFLVLQQKIFLVTLTKITSLILKLTETFSEILHYILSFQDISSSNRLLFDSSKSVNINSKKIFQSNYSTCVFTLSLYVPFRIPVIIPYAKTLFHVERVNTNKTQNVAVKKHFPSIFPYLSNFSKEKIQSG